MRLMSADVSNLPLGSRVVVRWRLETPDAATGATLTDAVGTLVGLDPERVVVDTSRGPVTIERARVVAAKQVPPKPHRRGAAHLASWGALERDTLGDWLLRASRGFTQRGNSVVPVGDPGLPLDRAVDEVERWYAARGLPAKFALAGPEGFEVADDALGVELLGRGYTEGSRTLTLTARTESIAAADPGGPACVLEDGLTDAWLSGYRRGDSAPAEAVRGVLSDSPRTIFGRITPGGGLSQQLGLRAADAAGTTPIALARLGIAHGWAGLGSVWTDPAYRGRGLAAHLTAQLAGAARAEGVALVHLQVEHENDGAIRLYRRMGFDTHSSYAYLTRPAQATETG
jgi:ribosomal protein S18 acetylase RimI-like enzyme